MWDTWPLSAMRSQQIGTQRQITLWRIDNAARYHQLNNSTSIGCHECDIEFKRPMGGALVPVAERLTKLCGRGQSTA